MKSYEAMNLLVGGDAASHAKRLGLSPRMIYRWCEPNADYSDSGAYNPLDRTRAMMEEAERLGKSRLKILAPVRYLATDLAMVIPVPRIDCTTTEICLQTIKTIKEVGEVLTAAGKALEDNKLTPNEKRDVLKKMDAAFHALATLQGMFRHG